MVTHVDVLSPLVSNGVFSDGNASLIVAEDRDRMPLSKELVAP